jgi:hypothetical protein
MRVDASPNEESRSLVYARRQADDSWVNHLARRSLVLPAAACALATAFFAGCSSGVKSNTAATSSPATPPPGPPNAPVPAAGAAGPIPLDDAQSAELQRAVGDAPPAVRARLRYALALGDDGQRHLVVYDGEGLDANGRAKGKAHDYVLFRVLNATAAEHYDPQQNALIAPMPVPSERAGSAASL